MEREEAAVSGDTMHTVPTIPIEHLQTLPMGAGYAT